jgi:poly(3-hydroxyalkanoate) synthetase
MHAAVLAASQKPLVTEALRQINSLLANVPDDIDWAAFQQGVQRYLAAPAHPPRPGYPEIARAGRATLRDAGGSGPVAVVVPSMVNRGYILDLLPGHSVVAALRESGKRVLLVDWAEPPATPPALTMSDVVIRHLEPLLQAAVAQNNGLPVGVVGYCMGGLLALAAAVRQGPDVAGKLALLATPWDFSVTPSAAHMAAARPVVEPWLLSQAVIPAEVMQQYFWLLDPWSPVRRLMAYGQSSGTQQAYLTALEDWLTDGLALDAPIGREILMDWFADNRALKGEWRVGGTAVTPGALKIPLWVALGQKDTLVPPGCALPLVAQSAGAQVTMVNAGHVGLVVGRQAPEMVYKPLANWLK